jgi:hypothetical protein
MRSEHVLSNDRLQLLRSLFQGLWRVDEAPSFGRLLRRIDDAVIQYRSHMRIMRLNRMLERDYPV